MSFHHGRVSLLLLLIGFLALTAGTFWLPRINSIHSQSEGAIWTTTDTCGTPQNSNHYVTGATVFINGDNFEPSSDHTWTITGQPGDASCDPGTIVASGAFSTDGTGTFCINAYVIAAGDCGEYSADVTGAKNDNFRIEGDEPTATATQSPTGIPALTATPAPIDPSGTPTPTPDPLQTPTPSLSVLTIPTSTPQPTGVPGQTVTPLPGTTDTAGSGQVLGASTDTMAATDSDPFPIQMAVSAYTALLVIAAGSYFWANHDNSSA
jgi:hypothetical protein